MGQETMLQKLFAETGLHWIDLTTNSNRYESVEHVDGIAVRFFIGSLPPDEGIHWWIEHKDIRTFSIESYTSVEEAAKRLAEFTRLRAGELGTALSSVLVGKWIYDLEDITGTTWYYEPQCICYETRLKKGDVEIRIQNPDEFDGKNWFCEIDWEPESRSYYHGTGPTPPKALKEAMMEVVGIYTSDEQREFVRRCLLCQKISSKKSL